MSQFVRSPEEQQPLNQRAEGRSTDRVVKNTPRTTTIHLGTDGGTNGAEIDLNINTNLTVSSTKMHKTLLYGTAFLILVAYIAVTVVVIYFIGEMKELKTEIKRNEQRFQHQQNDNSRSANYLYDYRRDSFDRSQTMHEPRLDSTPTDDIPPLVERNILEKNKTELEDYISLKRHNGVIHFTGALPDSYFKDGGTIGPWLIDHDTSSQDAMKDFDLNVDSESVTTFKPGVYFVYSQMLYLSRQPSCYFMLVRSPNDHKRRVVAQCCIGNDSTPFNGSPGEITCSTNTVVKLNYKESLYFVQREPNRTLAMDNGQSYFGLIRLS